MNMASTNNSNHDFSGKCGSVPSNAALPWQSCLHMGSYSFQSCFCQLLHGDVLQVPLGHQWSAHKSVQSVLNKNFTTRKALIISAWLQASTYSKFVLWYAGVKDLRYNVTLLCTCPNCFLNVLPVVHKNTSSRVEAFSPHGLEAGTYLSKRHQIVWHNHW